MTQQRRTAPARPAGRPPQGGALTPREQVLARRRIALIVLAVAVPATLVAAIVTGSIPLLIVNIAVGLALAGYIALLLQIKQRQQASTPRRPARDEDSDEMTVTPPR